MNRPGGERMIAAEHERQFAPVDGFVHDATEMPIDVRDFSLKRERSLM
jgi:hypothetical protein